MQPTCLIRVPYDSGWPDRRMGRGPEHFVRMGAADALKRIAGSVQEVMVRHDVDFTSENGTTFALLRAIAAQVNRASNAGRFPLMLAGNCSSTVGALAGLGSSRVGLVWFDGHGDFNTPETTTTGFLDGMGVSMAVGHCWTTMCDSIPGFEPLAEERVALVGPRDLDAGESERLRESGIPHVTCENVHDAGPVRALRPVLDQWTGKVDGVYLHIDMDVHDPGLVPANSLQPAGGLSPREVLDCLRTVADAYPVVGASITAYDPACDRDDRGAATGLDIVEFLGNVAHGQGA